MSIHYSSILYVENYFEEEILLFMTKKDKYTTWESLPDVLTAKHLSDYLSISRRRIYELFQISVEYGGIPNFEIGASKRVKNSDFKKWLSLRKQEKEEQLKVD